MTASAPEEGSSLRELKMFPLSRVLLPHENLPLHVFEERYRAMVADCMAADRSFGVVLIARGGEVGGGDVRREVGTVASIDHLALGPDGRSLLLTTGTDRIRVIALLPEEPYPRAIP